jgi:hypothetical protein
MACWFLFLLSISRNTHNRIDSIASNSVMNKESLGRYDYGAVSQSTGNMLLPVYGHERIGNVHIFSIRLRGGGSDTNSTPEQWDVAVRDGKYVVLPRKIAAKENRGFEFKKSRQLVEVIAPPDVLHGQIS